MLFLVFMLVLRLVYLQIIESSTYKTMADENRIQIRSMAAPRGHLLDRNGIVIAENGPIYQAILSLSQLKSKEIPALLEQVRPLLDLNDEDYANLKTLVKKQPRHIPLSLKKNLTWEEVSKLNLALWKLPGVEVIQTFKRLYHFGPITSHITGYVSLPSAKEIEEDPALALPDALIGKDGIEKIYEYHLRGINGKKAVEVNAKGAAIRLLSLEEPIPGQDLSLTIDYRLQKFVYDLLSPHTSAAAVVMDIETGEILALVSYPGYDPNPLVQGITQKQWTALLENPQAPFTNKITKGLYSPASLMKVVDDLVAYDHPNVNTNFHTHCGGHIEINRHKFHCWKKGGHGNVSLENSLFKSCDVYYYEAARKMGAQKIIDMAHILGLSHKTGIDLPGEKGGFLPSMDKKQKWYVGETLLLAIGQGKILTTPLQWARMMAQIARGGRSVTPHLTASAQQDPEELLDINPAALDHALHALGETANNPQGTAYKVRIAKPGFEMGCKTGTCQVRRISAQERKTGIRPQSALPWKLRDNGFFLGFAPVGAPKYVVAVLIEHGGWGSSIAAPVGAQILLKTQELLNTPQEAP